MPTLSINEKNLQTLKASLQSDMITLSSRSYVESKFQEAVLELFSHQFIEALSESIDISPDNFRIVDINLVDKPIGVARDYDKVTYFNVEFEFMQKDKFESHNIQYFMNGKIKKPKSKRLYFDSYVPSEPVDNEYFHDYSYASYIFTGERNDTAEGILRGIFLSDIILNLLESTYKALHSAYIKKETINFTSILGSKLKADVYENDYNGITYVAIQKGEAVFTDIQCQQEFDYDSVWALFDI